jgi:hypothetical protein
MSTQWNVTQGDNQFVVAGGLAELKNMARRGDLGPGDMLQPPGAMDWMYASEVPELQVIFAKNKEVDDDAESASGPNYLFLAIGGALAVLFVGIVIVGGGVAVYFGSRMTEGTGAMIGEGGLTYSQMIVTSAGTGLRSEPVDGGSIQTPVAKDEILELLAKRGNFYKARTRNGQEGWISLNQVLPMYQLGGADVRDEYDPLYNPDRYVEVSNARWIQMPAENGRPGELSNVTMFVLAVSNSSRYAMTDLRITATIKDPQGHELEKVEVAVEGEIPPNSETMIGSLRSEEAEKAKGKKREELPPARILTTASFEKMAEEDPELQLRWMDGFEVEMKTSEFTNANLDVVELRAIPDEGAKKGGKRKGR